MYGALDRHAGAGAGRRVRLSGSGSSSRGIRPDEYKDGENSGDELKCILLKSLREQSSGRAGGRSGRQAGERASE